MDFCQTVESVVDFPQGIPSVGESPRMNSSTLRQARERAIERQVKRLELRLGRLRTISNRVSWIRAGVFIAGLVLALVIGTQLNELAALYAVAAAGLLFALVVLYHRRLERWI